jgi:hypothetical protein
MHSANFTASSRLVAFLLPPLLPFSEDAFEQPAPIRATMARAASGRSRLLMFSPCGDCVDTGSLPIVLVTAASLDRA